MLILSLILYLLSCLAVSVALRPSRIWSVSYRYYLCICYISCVHATSYVLYVIYAYTSYVCLLIIYTHVNTHIKCMHLLLYTLHIHIHHIQRHVIVTKKEYVRFVSHELRTPLNTVVLGLNLAIDQVYIHTHASIYMYIYTHVSMQLCMYTHLYTPIYS